MAACKADYLDCDISVPVETLHCNVTAAYVRECKRHGIEMPLPDECCECHDFSHNMLRELAKQTNKQTKSNCVKIKNARTTWDIFRKASFKLTVHEMLLHCSGSDLGQWPCQSTNPDCSYRQLMSSIVHRQNSIVDDSMFCS